MADWHLRFRSASSPEAVIPINPYHSHSTVCLVQQSNGEWVLSHGMSRSSDPRPCLCSFSSKEGFVAVEVFKEPAFVQRRSTQKPSGPDDQFAAQGLPLPASSAKRQVMLMIRLDDVVVFPELKSSVELCPCPDSNFVEAHDTPSMESPPLKHQHIEVRSSGVGETHDKPRSIGAGETEDSPESAALVYSTAQTEVVHQTPQKQPEGVTDSSLADPPQSTLTEAMPGKEESSKNLALADTIAESIDEVMTANIAVPDGHLKSANHLPAMTNPHTEAIGEKTPRAIPSVVKRGRKRKASTPETSSKIVSSDLQTQPTVKRARKSECMEDVTPVKNEKKKKKKTGKAVSVKAKSTPPASSAFSQKSSSKTMDKSLVFTGSTIHLRADVHKFLVKHGITISDDVDDNPHLILCVNQGKIAPTAKLMTALVQGQDVVTDDWIMDSMAAKMLLTHTKYRAPNLYAADKPERRTIFQGKTVYFTPAVADAYGGTGFEAILTIMSTAGATAAKKSARDITDGDGAIVIAADKGDNDAQSLMRRNMAVYKKSLITESIMRGTLLTGDESYRVTRLSVSKGGRKV